MTNHNSTIKKLDEITEASKFERLATDVLRVSDYKDLIHPGVNAEGKTIKGPFDGIGSILKCGESSLVVVAHTTCKRTDILDKWLSDSTKSKPRKGRTKTTVQDGDLVKAVNRIHALRATNQVNQATVILTTNREPDTDTVLSARDLAKKNNINLDIWSASRIAQKLDSPQGQWIRNKYFGDAEQYISYDFLRRATLSSLENYTSFASEESVDRLDLESLNNGHILLVGPSGVGKSTIARQLLQRQYKLGGVGLIIPHETISSAVSIADAIDIVLRKIEPSLVFNAGTQALTFARATTLPFMVLVEDVNISADPFQTTEKLISWTQIAKSKKTSDEWRLVCPIWPRYVDSISQKYKHALDSMWQAVDIYTTLQAEEAVRKRSSIEGSPLLPQGIQFIASQLGNDPLLIGLCDFSGSINATAVIETYIEKEFINLASRSNDFTLTEIQLSASKLIEHMLSNGNLSPTVKNLKDWFSEDKELWKVLNFVLKSSSVLRLVRRQSEEVVIFRHDRVLLTLMTGVLKLVVQDRKFEVPYFSDPYFAEAVGSALTNSTLTEKLISEVVEINPLSLFYAYHYSSKRSDRDSSLIVWGIKQWLSKSLTITNTHLDKYRTLRWRALQILSEIDSPDMLAISDLFPKENYSLNWYQARFRNGDINSGLLMLTMFESLGVNFKGRKELLNHVFERFGTQKIATSLQIILNEYENNDRIIDGCLQMAGYLGSELLATAIHTRWLNTQPNERNLKLYLWASARCFDPFGPNTLALVCDTWAALPDKSDNELSRSNLASENVAWEFKKYIPLKALPYLIERSLDKTLEWPIIHMIRDIDHPIALERMAHYLAERERINPENVFPADTILLSSWERGNRNFGISMSIESKSKLLDIFLSSDNDAPLKKSAFRIWEKTITSDDLIFLRSIDKTSVVYKSSIRARARRKDYSVIPDLLKLVNDAPEYWLHLGRYIWSDEMTNVLEELIKIESEKLKAGGSRLTNEVHEFSKRLMEIDTSRAEKILINYWDGLRLSNLFIHSAIYIASPKIMELVHEEVAKHSNKEKLFEYLMMHMGWKEEGRTGITRIEQVKCICEFIDFLSDHDVNDLIEICDHFGWNEIKKNILVPKLRGSLLYGGHEYNTVNILSLDLELNSGPGSYTYNWIEHNLRAGNTMQEIMHSALEWLQKNPNARAFKIIADVIGEKANRADLHAIKELVKNWPNIEDQITDLEFRIKHRTIS